MSAVAAGRPRKRTGLALLLVAIAAGLAAYVIAGLGLRGKVPANIGIYGPLIVVGYLIAWFVVRLWVAPKRAAEALPEGTRTAGNS